MSPVTILAVAWAVSAIIMFLLGYLTSEVVNDRMTQRDSVHSARHKR